MYHSSYPAASANASLLFFGAQIKELTQVLLSGFTAGPLVFSDKLTTSDEAYFASSAAKGPVASYTWRSMISLVSLGRQHLSTYRLNEAPADAELRYSDWGWVWVIFVVVVYIFFPSSFFHQS